jgi:uncharacterized membrane protein
MNTESQNKIERLAKTSRVFGILAVVLLIIPFLRLLYPLRGPNYYGETGFGLAVLAMLSFLGWILSGVIACVTALSALARNRREGNNTDTRKIATLGLKLGGLSVLIAVLIFIYVSIAASGNRPPNLPTPIPSTAIP